MKNWRRLWVLTLVWCVVGVVRADDRGIKELEEACAAVSGVRAGAAVGLRPVGPRVVQLIDDPVGLLSAKDASASMGAMVRIHDKELRTTIYHPLNEPAKDGTIPWVAPDAKAVIIFLHGSGTPKASGRNFLNLMNTMHNAKVASVSFDMPFHKDGPTDSQFDDTKYFMEWIHKIVMRAKAYGKPVYMAGHSFGPWVIQEYISIPEYRKDIEGALLISPSGDWHPALRWTYDNITMPGMKYIDMELKDAGVNIAGGEWSYKVERGGQWLTRQPPLTQVNVLLGETDEWWPGNTRLPGLLGVNQIYTFDEPLAFLKTKYPEPYHRFNVVKGVGHYIFEAKAANGRNLLTELLFDMMKVDGDARYQDPPVRSARQQLATLYHHYPAFNQWIGARYPHAMRSDETAAEYLKGWEAANRQAWRRIMTDIPTQHPEFYQARRDSWARMMTYLNSDQGRADERRADVDWSNEMKTLQSTFLRYLEGKRRGEPVVLGRDPLTPATPSIEEGLLSAVGEPSKWGFRGSFQYALYKEAFTAFAASVPERASWTSEERVAPLIVKVKYKLDGKDFEIMLLDTSVEQARTTVEEAFINARRNTDGFQLPPPADWRGTYGDVVIVGSHKVGTITRVTVSPKP